MSTNKNPNTATAPESDDVEMNPSELEMPPFLKRRAADSKPDLEVVSDKSEAETGPETPATEPAVDSGAATPDPFHPSNLRLSQAFAETAGVKKLLTTVPVRKPSQQDFVRTHPGDGYHEDFPVIDLKDEREEYIVTANLVDELVGEFVCKTLFLAINRRGTLFFWPVRLPSSDSKDMEWWRSSREAAALAMRDWVRVRANMDIGAYDIFKAASTMAEPEWPELTYWELIKIAFRDHLIDRIDHPVIKRLRGIS